MNGLYHIRGWKDNANSGNRGPKVAQAEGLQCIRRYSKSFWNGTLGTSTWRETTPYGVSIRSSSGPESRPRSVVAADEHGAARAGVLGVAEISARTRVLGVQEHEVRWEGQAAH